METDFLMVEFLVTRHSQSKVLGVRETKNKKDDQKCGLNSYVSSVFRSRSLRKKPNNDTQSRIFHEVQSCYQMERECSTLGHPKELQEHRAALRHCHMHRPWGMSWAQGNDSIFPCSLSSACSIFASDDLCTLVEWGTEAGWQGTTLGWQKKPKKPTLTIISEWIISEC